MQKFRIKELQEFFLIKKYSQSTQEIIKLIFINREKHVDIAKQYNLKPQRIHNIKKQFLADYQNAHQGTFVKFEGYISVDLLNDLQEFKQKCKSFKIFTI